MVVVHYACMQYKSLASNMFMAFSAYTTASSRTCKFLVSQQVMQLGEVEVVETWRDGDIRYEKEVQTPDYDRYNDAPLHKRSSAQS